VQGALKFMTPAASPTVALPADPVSAELDDPGIQQGLLGHARAGLMGRPAAVREEAAAEAVQDCHLRALERRQQYDPALGSVAAWLHGIMNHVLRETARSVQRQPAQAEEGASWEDRAASAVQLVCDQSAANDYLSQLQAEHQEILRLRFYEDLGEEAIAARLGISPGNARVRLCRALAAARALAGARTSEGRP